MPTTLAAAALAASAAAGSGGDPVAVPGEGVLLLAAVIVAGICLGVALSIALFR